MGTITGYTAAKMQIVEDAAIVGGHLTGNNLILEAHDGGTIDAGAVKGPKGDTGPMGEVSTSAMNSAISTAQTTLTTSITNASQAKASVAKLTNGFSIPDAPTKVTGTKVFSTDTAYCDWSDADDRFTIKKSGIWLVYVCCPVGITATGSTSYFQGYIKQGSTAIAELLIDGNSNFNTLNAQTMIYKSSDSDEYLYLYLEREVVTAGTIRDIAYFGVYRVGSV